MKGLLPVLLVFNAAQRVSFQEALNTEYMKNWAEPALVRASGKGLSSCKFLHLMTINSEG